MNEKKKIKSQHNDRKLLHLQTKNEAGIPSINLYSNISIEILYPDPAYQQSAKSHLFSFFSPKYQAKEKRCKLRAGINEDPTTSLLN